VPLPVEPAVLLPIPAVVDPVLDPAVVLAAPEVEPVVVVVVLVVVVGCPVVEPADPDVVPEDVPPSPLSVLLQPASAKEKLKQTSTAASDRADIPCPFLSREKAPGVGAWRGRVRGH
jgi:hypothetical protein